MMAKPPEAIGTDEICPICKKPKKEHSAEEIYSCSKKMMESSSDKDK